MQTPVVTDEYTKSKMFLMLKMALISMNLFEFKTLSCNVCNVLDSYERTNIVKVLKTTLYRVRSIQGIVKQNK